MVEADAYALVYGNLVNSERVASYVSHVSGEDEVDFDPDPSEIKLHGENMRPITLSGYRREVSHVMSEDLIEDEERFSEYDFMMDMLREQYPDTENRGGLNIHEEAGSEMNAVLVPMTDEELEFYEESELGYHLEQIDPSIVSTEVEKPVIAAVSHNTGDAEPINGYIEDCLDSWREWGEIQRDTFLETTFVDGEPLHEWISQNSVLQNNL